MNSKFKFVYYICIIVIILFSNKLLFSQYGSCDGSPCGNLNNYTLSGQKWNKSLLKYYFINGTIDISGDGEKSAFVTAFNKWGAVVPLKFEETSLESQADIKIHFANGTEFSTTGATEGARAVAYFPEQDCKGYLVLNDDAYIFSLLSNQNVDLVYVATHEIGHLLGLCHSSNSNTMMWGSYVQGRRNLHTYDIQGIQEIYSPIPVKIENNFTGGIIYVNNYSISKTAPVNLTINSKDDLPVSIGAIDQNDGTYNRIWNDTEAPLYESVWLKETITGNSNVESSNQNETIYPASNDRIYEAGLRKICGITFKNNFIGISSSGNMKVNGISYSAPTSNFNVVEQNKITAEATQYYEINGIKYAFQNWEGEGTSRLKDFYPSLHKQYVANYKGTPLYSDVNYRNLTFNTFNPRVTQNVILNWSEHPNTSVTKYQIWRHEKYNGVYTSPVLLATVNRGTTTWTDNGFYIGNSYSDYQLFYDVRAYYSTENTYSVDSYKQCHGTSTAVNKKADTDSLATIEEILENSISNYPNPYNPTTTISYQIKEVGNVQITVYDALGRKVKELVNEIKNPGKYEVKFDGSKLSSGIYFYTMNINIFTSSKKMLLTK